MLSLAKLKSNYIYLKKHIDVYYVAHCKEVLYDSITQCIHIKRGFACH